MSDRDAFRENRAAGLRARHETRLARICSARYEPEEPEDMRTHTCALPAGHLEKHHCPRCGIDWEADHD